ncbi:MAG: DinB family protein [candidate division Zixibacteria bacterium]|jgi:uncharacterized damage-inducible protein DinB|nr:DinB family protein [candidate division Zixibacteria bacterium]
MALRDVFLAEFDHEMANTRKTLERVPENKFGWRPHVKSLTMQDLASHVANLPSWTPLTLQQDSFDVAQGGNPVRAPRAQSADQLVKIFDENVEAARKAISATSDEEFQKPWSLLSSGHVYFTMPRAAVLRSFVFNHLIHHRAQLTVYLRMNDVAVPALYGPSADEQNM